MADLAIQHQRTWGALWDGYLATCIDSNQTSEARRLRIGESKLRSWVKDNRSPSMDWVLLNAHRLPPALLANLLNTLADGRFTVEPVDAECGVNVDLVCYAIDLHKPVAALGHELRIALADERFTPDELTKLRHACCGLLALIRAVLTELTLAGARRHAGRIVRWAGRGT